MPEEKDVPKRRGIIVGTNYTREDYDKNIHFGELKGAENDATDIFERLNYSFEIPKKCYLRGDEATSDKIRSAICDVFYRTDERCDQALFYFSGHGFVDYCNNGYIVPYDMTKQNAFAYGIRMTALKEVISNAIKQGFIDYAIAILDCCHSGITTEEKDGADAGATFIDNFEALQSGEGGEGVIVLPSSVGDQKSREELFQHGDEEEHYHGVFTHCVLEGLDHGAVDDPSGIIYLKNLDEWLENNLPQGVEGRQEYKPYFNASKVSTLRFAECKGKYLGIIMELIKNAENLYNKEKRTTLDFFRLVDMISRVLELSPSNNRALSIKENINNVILVDLQKGVYGWFSDHDRDIQNKTPYLYEEIECLVIDDFPDFDRITKLDTNKMKLIMYLCRAGNKEINLTKFIKRCRLLNIARSPRATKEDMRPQEEITKIHTAKKPKYTTPDGF